MADIQIDFKPLATTPSVPEVTPGEQALQQPVPPGPPIPSTQPVAIDFKPVDFPPVPDSVAVSQSQTQAPIDFQAVGETPKSYSDVEKTMKRGFFEAPLLGTETTTESELDAIANKYKVNPADLKSLASFFGSKRDPEEGPKELAGSLGRGLFGAPQFLIKKFQSDPNMELALDDVRELADQKRSFAQGAAEGLLPGGAIGAIGKGVRGLAAAGAVTGGLYGLTGSRKGEELKGTAIGTSLGAGLGAGAGLIGEAISKRLQPNDLEKSLMENQAVNKQFDLEKGISEVADRTVNSEKLIEDIGLGQKTALSNQEMDQLLTEQLGKEQYTKYLDPSTEENALIRNSTGASTDSAIKAKLTEDVISSRIVDFAEDLTRERPKNIEEAMKSLQEYAGRQGEEATANRYKDFVREQQAEKYIKDNGLRAINEPSFFGRALNFMSDNQFVARNIDNKYGTRLEGAITGLNKDYNRSTFALQDFRNKYDNVYQEARKAGTDDVVSSGHGIYDALDQGTVAALNPAEQKTAQSFRDYFNQIRDFTNGLVKDRDPRIAPLDIPHLENYVPKMVLPTGELVSVMEKRIDQAQKELSTLLGREIRDLGQLKGDEYKLALEIPAVKDLVAAVSLADNRGARTAQDLSTKLKEMLYSRNGNIALETKARAAMERVGEIPDFMLEKNLFKLARRYTDNTLRHLYLRNGIDKLRYQARSLEKAGAEVESKYIQNLIQDLMGIRKGTAAEASLQASIQMSRALDRMIDKVGKDTVRGGVLTTAKAFPSMMQAALRQIYPNVLGYFNIRAVLQNTTQALTKTWPELGTGYGASALLRGSLSTVGNFKRLSQKATSLGNIPAEFTRKGERAIAEGIQKSSLYQLPASVIDGAGKAGMYIFQKSEEWNRALTVGVAETMARDIARGSNAVLGSLKKFPYAVRQEVLRARSNPQEVTDILAKYLNDVTQYNYNKISMSEFGRTMGPFFSVFSKWPTATAGDIIQEMQSKGVLGSLPRNFEKYVAPFILLQAMDHIAGEEFGSKDGLSDRQKLLMGSGGLSQSAPIGSIGGIIKGEIFTPPIVDMLMKTAVEPIIDGHSAKFERGAANMAKSFVPFAGLYRLLTTDLVTYATGNKPEPEE